MSRNKKVDRLIKYCSPVVYLELSTFMYKNIFKNKIEKKIFNMQWLALAKLGATQ